MDVRPSVSRGTQLVLIWILGLLGFLVQPLSAQTQLGVDVFLVTISEVQAPDCFDSSNGQLLATPANGIPPYTYLWNDPSSQTTPIATGLPAGNYSCTVFDQTGDFGIDNFQFQAPAPLQLLFNETPTCPGESNGSIDLLVNGGTPPFTFQWNNGAGTVEDPIGLLAGNYLVTVQDANGCINQNGILVPEYPNPLSLFVESTDISCFGICDGTAEAIVNGGTSNYTYLWDNGATGSFQTGLCPGVHGVSVNDDNGCSLLFNFFTGFSPGFIVSSVETDLACGGFDNGAIDLSVALANPPYTYLWNTGATTEDVNNLPEGNYTVTITDFAGCETIYATSIDAPPAISVTAVVTNPICGSNPQGAIDVNVNGGVPPLTYLWADGLGTFEDVNGLSPGEYTLSISDANACTIQSTFTVETSDLLYLTTNVTDLDCDGNQPGSITITPSGGLSPYTFQWNTGATTASLTGLNGGWYELTLSDANACVLTTSVEVNEPDLDLVSLDVIVTPACQGDLTGALQATVSGGVAPLTYSWSIPGAPNVPSVNGLAAGQYFMTLSDASGCSQIADVTIPEPLALTASIQNVQDLSCFGLQNASAEIVVNGGTLPYSYLWSSGTTSSTANDLFGGNQNILILDANGCDQLINFFVFEPPALIADAAVTDDISCNGEADGAINLNASGGTPPYSFSWSNGGTVQNPIGLTAGNYSVTVEDQSGCKAFDAAQVQEPLPLIGSVGLISGVSCNGGTDGFAVANASGGVPFYTFLWDDGTTTSQASNLDAGIHSVSITDINNCSIIQTVTVTEPPVLDLQLQSQSVTCEGGNQGSIQALVAGGAVPYTFQWSNGGTQDQINNLIAATYSLTLTDANGCLQTQSLLLQAPEGLEIDIVSSPVTCSYLMDGTAAANISGGLSPYTWLWQTGATTQSISGLAAGTYNCSVQDANGCSSVQSFGIGSPAALKIKAQSMAPVRCFGEATGSLQVTIEGGIFPYTFNWSNGASAASLDALQAGTYTLSVQDANSCIFGPVDFMIDQPDSPVSATFESVEPTCSYRSDGSLDVRIEGGTSGYTIEWFNGSTTNRIDELSIGDYQIRIQDGNDCVSEWTYSLAGPAPIEVFVDTRDPSCNGDSDGRIQVDTSNLVGGTLPFIYQLEQSFQTTNRFDGLAAGAYMLTVQDVQGCEAVFPVDLYDPPVLMVDLGADQQIELGEQVELRPQVNSNSIMVYQWSPSTFLNCIDCSTLSFQPLEDIEYRLVVQDSNACEATDRIRIAVEPISELFVPNAFSPNDDGRNDQLMIFGGASIERALNFVIFDRWGERVFQAQNFLPNDPSIAWDGRMNGQALPAGVYIYVLEVEFIDGRILPFRGDITLMR